LISKARSGNNEAFEKLLNIYLKIIYNYISSHVSNSEDKKDIVQDTMLSVWKAIKSFDGISSFKTWVLGITRRKIADYYRLIYRGSPVSLNECEDLLIADDEYCRVIDKTVINEALSVLNSSEREMVFLIFNAQLSYPEISQITDIPVGTIKSRMSVIKSKLKNKLKEGDYNGL
jgi:RNA polymerase sigma-70 factor (ECF subfamily)